MMKSMLSRSVILLLAVLVSLSVTAAPVIMWEDFEDAGGAPAFDSSFLHAIGSHPDAPGSPEWVLSDLYSPSDCLWLYPAADYITFDLDAGDYVQHASVDLSDRGGDTTVEFIGETGTLTFDMMWVRGRRMKRITQISVPFRDFSSIRMTGCLTMWF